MQTAPKPEGHTDAKKLSKYYYRACQFSASQFKWNNSHHPILFLHSNVYMALQLNFSFQVSGTNYVQIGEKYCGINACDSVYIAPFVS